MQTRFKNQTLYFTGKMAGANRKDAQSAAKECGAAIVNTLQPKINIIVVGEADLLSNNWSEHTEQLRAQIPESDVEIITESEFWQRCDQSTDKKHERTLFTAAMLADLIGVPNATIRKWHRSGLITEAKSVHKLPYFDFQEVNAAKRLRDWLQTGMSPTLIAKRLEELQHFLPNMELSLAKLPLMLDGKNVLIRHEGKLLDQKGQQRFDFEDENRYCRYIEDADDMPFSQQLSNALAPSSNTLYEMAVRLQEEGDFEAALDAYRAALMAGEQSAAIHFQIAEILYLLGDLPAARERYFVALELDDKFIEARANLGCVLSELGDYDLAIHTFRGALALHSEYADVHYHLGATLLKVQRFSEAKLHFQYFLEISPLGPWAERVKSLLETI